MATDRKQPSLKNIHITSISKDMEASADKFIDCIITTDNTIYSRAMKKGTILDLGCPSFRPPVRPSDVCFDSMSSEKSNRISPNFVYALISTRSRLDLFHIIFRAYAIELWPLVYVRISFRIFVSAQYLENKWTDFHQILNMH